MFFNLFCVKGLNFFLNQGNPYFCPSFFLKLAMEFIIQISQFLLSLSLLIILHEFGHFLPARLFKTRVEKFFLFFDVKFALFQKKIGETVYGIGWLPLGGYVKISGMIDESMDKEQMAQPAKPWEFRSKPAWQRLIIMLGGVIMNFIIALLIYIFASFFYGESDISTSSLKDGYFVENEILKEIGFKTGDQITAVDGVAYENYSDLRKNLIVAEQVTIKRNGVEQTINLPTDFLGRLSDQNDRTLFELRIPFLVGKVDDASPNINAGLKQGDYIYAINNEPTPYYDVIVNTLNNYKGQEVIAQIKREGQNQEINLNVTPEGKLGIYPAQSYKVMEDLGLLKTVQREYGFFESFGVGVQKFGAQMTGYFDQLKKIFNPSTGAYKGVGGFKAIFDIFPDQWSWQAFWGITAFLSIMLGVLNLLPIPALDGGHVMFLLWEMVTGKKPSDKFLEYAQVVGFFLLIALVLFANGNDIYRALFK